MPWSTRQVQLALKEELAAGITFAKARERAVGRVFGERVSQILQQPNNVLAVEYLAQLRGLSPERRPQAVPLERVGNAHDGAPVQGFASASYLRGLLLAGEWEQAAEYLPDFALHLYRQVAKEGKLAWMENGERAVLSALRADEPGGAGGPARPFRGDREPAVCSGAEGLFAGGTLRADQNQALPALAGASAGAGGLLQIPAQAHNPAPICGCWG